MGIDRCMKNKYDIVYYKYIKLSKEMVSELASRKIFRAFIYPLYFIRILKALVSQPTRKLLAVPNSFKKMNLNSSWICTNRYLHV